MTIRLSLLSAEEEAQVKAGTLQEEVGEYGTVYYVTVKPFEQLTCREFIRVTGYKPGPNDSDLKIQRDMFIAYTGAPGRFVNVMSIDEAERAVKAIKTYLESLGAHRTAKAKVDETLANWAKEHDEKEWTIQDASDVLKEHGIFRDTITAKGETFTAPMVEVSDFGRWISLQAEMNISQSEPESYCRACAVMMDGQDGRFPVLGEHNPRETDAEYETRGGEYIARRAGLMMDAPYVEVLGCAAFFFSKSQRFAEITGHNMSLLNGWLSPKSKREPNVIPSGGVLMPS